MDEDKGILPSEEDLKLGEEPETVPPVVEPSQEPNLDSEEEGTPVPNVEPEQEEEEEVAPPTPRESKRIQQILEKMKQREEIQLPKSSQEQKTNKPIIGEGEYDIDEINRIAQEAAQRRYEEGLAEVDARTAQIQNALQFQTRLELDAPKVQAKYDFLNQDSDNFDPGAASFINEMYLKTVGYNPQTGTVQNNQVRYDEFVEGIVELRETLAAAKAADSQANIAKQAAKTGVRPGGGVAKTYSGDDPTKMSDEQLDAVINASLAALPRKR